MSMDDNFLVDQLPKLRKDISIKSSGYDNNNTPSWIINDHVNGTVHRIGWLQYEIITRWNLGSESKIISSINENTTQTIQHEDITKVIKFLNEKNLLDVTEEQLVQSITSNNSAIDNFLGSKIYLIAPDRFFTRLLPFIRIVLSPIFIFLQVFVAVFGLLYVVIDYKMYLGIIYNIFKIKIIAYFILSFFISVLIYEISKAVTAKFFKCTIRSAGVSLFFLVPLPFIDSSESKLLINRKQRLLVSGSGMFFEVIFALNIAFLLGVFSNVMSIEFFSSLVIVILTKSVLLNLNPFLKQDLYIFISEYLSTNLLREHVQKLSSWMLRKKIFGIDEKIPLQCTNQDLKIYLVYAFVTWSYKIILSIIIITLSYFYMSEILAVILIMAATYLFIFNPIIRQLRIILKTRKEVTIKPFRLIMGSTFILMLLTIFFIPVQTKLVIPAAITFAQESEIYAKHVGKIKIVKYRHGQNIPANYDLISADSFNLDYDIKKLMHDIDIIKLKLEQEVGHELDLDTRDVSIIQLTDKQNQLNKLLAEQQDLNIKAPHEGMIININHDIKPNCWVNKGEYLLTIANTKLKQIEGYIKESEVDNFPLEITKVTGKFYPNNYDIAPINVQILELDRTAPKYLDNPYFASIYGGHLNVYTSTDIEATYGSETNLLLQDTAFRVIAKPVNTNSKLPDFAIKGELLIYGDTMSLFNIFTDYVSSLFT